MWKGSGVLFALPGPERNGGGHGVFLRVGERPGGKKGAALILIYRFAFAEEVQFEKGRAVLFQHRDGFFCRRFGKVRSRQEKGEGKGCRQGEARRLSASGATGKKGNIHGDSLNGRKRKDVFFLRKVSDAGRVEKCFSVGRFREEGGTLRAERRAVRPGF